MFLLFPNFVTSAFRRRRPTRWQLTSMPPSAPPTVGSTGLGPLSTTWRHFGGLEEAVGPGVPPYAWWRWGPSWVVARAHPLGPPATRSPFCWWGSACAHTLWFTALRHRVSWRIWCCLSGEGTEFKAKTFCILASGWRWHPPALVTLLKESSIFPLSSSPTNSSGENPWPYILVRRWWCQWCCSLLGGALWIASDLDVAWLCCLDGYFCHQYCVSTFLVLATLVVWFLTFVSFKSVSYLPLLLLLFFFFEIHTVQHRRSQHAHRLTPMKTRTQTLPLWAPPKNWVPLDRKKCCARGVHPTPNAPPPPPIALLLDQTTAPCAAFPSGLGSRSFPHGSEIKTDFPPKKNQNWLAPASSPGRSEWLSSVNNPKQWQSCNVDLLL
jgi:hypothetical protein